MGKVLRVMFLAVICVAVSLATELGGYRCGQQEDISVCVTWPSDAQVAGASHTYFVAYLATQNDDVDSFRVTLAYEFEGEVKYETAFVLRWPRLQYWLSIPYLATFPVKPGSTFVSVYVVALKAIGSVDVRALRQ